MVELLLLGSISVGANHAHRIHVWYIYTLYTYIYHINHPNVGRYPIHGSYTMVERNPRKIQLASRLNLPSL